MWKKRALLRCGKALIRFCKKGLPAVRGAARHLVAAARCAGDFFVVVIPCIVHRYEELKAVDLWWVNAHANVREECLVVGAPKVVVLLAAPFVIDPYFHALTGCPNCAEGDAVLGIVERVEARVDAVVTVILILIEEGVTGDGFD